MRESLLLRGGQVRADGASQFSAALFQPGNGPEQDVRISYLSSGFLKWFGSRVEPSVPPLSLVWYELQDNAGDQSILEELGSIPVEVPLATVFGLMKRQDRGQPGPLANNGWGNDFYVRDASGQLRSVYVHWCDGGWGVDALPIVRQSTWPIRDRVFVPAPDSQNGSK